MTGYAARREAQTKIIGALQTLGIPRGKWPSFVLVPLPTEALQTKTPGPFQPPHYKPSHQSLKEWGEEADVAWGEYRENYMARQQQWVELGIDPPTQEAKRQRSAGRPNARRRNSAPENRYKWAALRIAGHSWKDIAFEYQSNESNVTKAASQVLRTAGWPTKQQVVGRTEPVREDYPKCKYHREHPEGRVVRNADEESGLGPGWTDIQIP
jgi:hypothetical protein